MRVSRRMNKWGGLACVSLLCSVLVTSAMAEERRTVTVFAAASLADVLTDVAHRYERETGTKVLVNLAGSNMLRVQIENGAPCDVFISADSLNMEVLAKADRLLADTRRVVLKNGLVLVEREGLTGALDDLSQIFLGEGETIALADMMKAPAGKYARQALEAAGVWMRVERHVVPAADVRAVLTYVERGDARYGMIYRTDARLSKKVRIVYAVPDGMHDPVRYEGAVIKGAAGLADAVGFLEFLGSAEAKGIFQKYGFNE